MWQTCTATSWYSFSWPGDPATELAGSVSRGGRRLAGALVCATLLCCWALAGAGAVSAQVHPAPVSLFDGESLSNWVPSDFHPSGEIVVRDGAVVLSAGDPLTGITYAGDFPREEYEVLVEARRVAGSDFFATLTFPVGDDYCSLVVGGWGGRVVGLSSLEGADASQNETTRWIPFEEGRWYRIRLRVAEGRISASIDGERVVDLAYTGRLLSPRIEVLPSRPFGIATWNTAAEIRRIEVAPLSSDTSGAIEPDPR